MLINNIKTSVYKAILKCTEIEINIKTKVFFLFLFNLNSTFWSLKNPKLLKYLKWFKIKLKKILKTIKLVIEKLYKTLLHLNIQ